SRVPASEAGGSGLTMMIQPASGPGVCERARWRIWPKPWVVIRPTRAPLDSSTALVATAVPWTTLPRAAWGGDASGAACGGTLRVRGVFPPPMPVIAVVDEEQVGERSSDVHAQPI